MFYYINHCKTIKFMTSNYNLTDIQCTFLRVVLDFQLRDTL